VGDYSRSRMTQQITSYNLRHDDSAELMFIVCVMMQHIMNDVMWGLYDSI
jgi:hypothetical protein